MKVNNKSWLALGGIAAVSIVLAGCAGNAAQPEATEDAATTLTVWVDSERVDALKGAADAYSDKTGVTVDLVGKDNNTIKDDFIQQAPTGRGPDVVMGAHDWLGELSTNGVVAPIELGDTADAYAPVALQASTDIIPEAATSFDDMIAKGQAAGLATPFVVEQGAEGNPYHLYPFQTAFGAPVFGTDAEGNYDPADLQLGNPGGFEFATWLGTQGAAGNFNTDIDGQIAKDKFLAGEAAFWLTGPWNVGSAVDAGINVAIDTVPSPTGEPASPFAGVKGFFISSESGNKVAANDFLVNYIGTEDVQLALFEAGNVLPALTAAADTAAADPIVAGFQTVGAEAVPMPAIPAMGSVWAFWGVAEAAIINGADPAATWQKLVDDVTAAIK
jgi:arabinogalactan oligomer/maltooligosaccharide transport system substrate-binding protein